ncbi:hypothetical protein VTJ04DRAFT_4132 [Mycothermus thermophilus]|uniref:uncharacterized protein n=1 Tax=Humicola insolens TaxID=85995 RepID=UPI003741EC9F
MYLMYPVVTNDHDNPTFNHASKSIYSAVHNPLLGSDNVSRTLVPIHLYAPSQTTRLRLPQAVLSLSFHARLDPLTQLNGLFFPIKVILLPMVPTPRRDTLPLFHRSSSMH